MYTIHDFTPPQGFRYAISDVSDGNQSFMYGDFETVKSARKAFLERANIPAENTVVMLVKHGDVIVEVGNEDRGLSVFNQELVKPCDAMITNKKNVALYLLVADCVPIVLFDKAQTCLAIVHHGIKNTKIALIENVIKTLEKKYGVKAKDLTALVGPAIQKESYVYDHFDQADTPLWKGFVEQREDRKFYIDNVGLTLKQLETAGIALENIYNSGVDTKIDPRFFSHKEDFDKGLAKDTGRIAMVAMLEG